MRHAPETIILERDDRLDAVDEILDRCRAHPRAGRGALTDVHGQALLERQSSLLRHLTSGAAIFGENEPHTVDPAPARTRPRLLAIEARSRFEKRMDKISAVFPRTFELSGGGAGRRSFREFSKAIRRSASAGWRMRANSPISCPRAGNGAAPAALPPDVSACELAFATARAVAQDRFADPEISSTPPTEPELRRSLRCSLCCAARMTSGRFREGSEMPRSRPCAREVALAILARASADPPQIFELAPAVFELLGSLDDWATWRPSGTRGCEQADRRARAHRACRGRR